MSKVQGTVVIRDRGQLTIPEKIREVRPWASPVSVVTISSVKPNEIIIQPYAQVNVDWNKIWTNIEKSRSQKGKKVTLSEFIVEDRSKH